MKKLITRTSILGAILIYLAIAFIKGNINPYTWGQSIRAVYIVSCIGWIAITPLIAMGIEDMENNKHK
jgi:hypothetical protein